MLLARLFRVIIYETQHAKTGRDWPVKRRSEKRQMKAAEAALEPTFNIMAQFLPTRLPGSNPHPLCLTTRPTARFGSKS
jgi:hypothetical protein